jgi:hypothetical protein
VDPRASLNAVKSLVPPGNPTPAVKPVAIAIDLAYLLDNFKYDKVKDLHGTGVSPLESFESLLKKILLRHSC